MSSSSIVNLINPIVSDPYDEKGKYHFTLSGVNVSIANSIRRVILHEIPTMAFYTDTQDKSVIHIEANTSRFHNEIVKQRLSCIPIYTTDLTTLPENYVMEVDVKNETDNIVFVTTEDFKVRHKTTGEYLPRTEVEKLFPKNTITQMHIDFLRLRPKISDAIAGEHIKLTCAFNVATAKVNSMFNVVSVCAYGNTVDPLRAQEAWQEVENKLVASGIQRDEIEFQKKNFMILDAQRYYKPDSFDFVIKTLGVFDNHELVKKACAILQGAFVDFMENVQSDKMTVVLNSDTTMLNCYDIVLENEDYTLGKVLEYFLYVKYFQGDKVMSYCGFCKFHPANTDSIIRVAYREPTDKSVVRQHIYSACNDAQEIYKKIYSQF